MLSPWFKIVTGTKANVEIFVVFSILIEALPLFNVEMFLD